jgi:hypothetical protein
MEKTRSIDSRRSPPQGMDEAIDLAIVGHLPIPRGLPFIDSDTASGGLEINRAADGGLPVVLVAEDGTRVLMHEAATR